LTHITGTEKFFFEQRRHLLSLPVEEQPSQDDRGSAPALEFPN